jgi:hypothetical protein
MFDLINVQISKTFKSEKCSNSKKFKFYKNHVKSCKNLTESRRKPTKPEKIEGKSRN